MTTLIPVFYLYEYINGKMKNAVKIGYGVVFPNNKTIYNKYANDKISVYNSFEEFNRIMCKGNRSVIFLNMIQQDDNNENKSP